MTVNVDFLLRKVPNTPEQLQTMIETIISAPTGNDFVTFEIKDIAPIAVAKKYVGIGVSLVARIKDVNGKKYGLIFEEHHEEIEDVLGTHTPVLTEDKDLFINNGGQINFLIEGGNLASMDLLKKVKKNGIDVIFIDPPYHRGLNDFIYDDNYIVNTDTFKHSKYLSFMKKRLIAAKMVVYL